VVGATTPPGRQGCAASLRFASVLARADARPLTPPGVVEEGAGHGVEPVVLDPPRPGRDITVRQSRPGTLEAVPATAPTAPSCTRAAPPRPENTRPRLDRCSAHRVRPHRPHRPRSRPVLGVPLRQLASDPSVPVEGGNDNAYEYCGGDPINCYDLDGQVNLRKWWKAHGSTVITAAALVGGAAICAGSAGVGCALAVGAVGGAASVTQSAYANNYFGGRRTRANTRAFQTDAAFAAVGVVLGAAGSKISTNASRWMVREGASPGAMTGASRAISAQVSVVSSGLVAAGNTTGTAVACRNGC